MRIVAAAFMAASVLAGCDTNSPAATEARAERYANEAERRATFMAADWSPIKTALLTCAEYTRNGAPSPEVLKTKGFAEIGRSRLKGTLDSGAPVVVDWGFQAKMVGQNGCQVSGGSPDPETARAVYAFAEKQVKAAGYSEVASNNPRKPFRKFLKGGTTLSMWGTANWGTYNIGFFQ